MKLKDVLTRTESFRAVDKPAAAASGAIRKVLAATNTDRLLTGTWLGHPLHPLVVTVPIGAWVCSAVLDMCGASYQRAARRLIETGLVATAPAVLLGVADYSELNESQRRVAVLHAGTNVVAATLFTSSWVARRRDHPGRGKLISMLGLGVLSCGGALGGHLTYAQGAGVRRR